MGMDSWVSSPLFTNIVIALFINFIVVFLFPAVPNLVKSPSHPKGVQTVLPRQMSQSIPNNPPAAWNILPVFVGNINTTTPLKWAGICFEENEARLELRETPGSQYGGGTVYVEVGQANTWYCADHYIFVTAARSEYDYYFKSGLHKVDFAKWKSQLEFDYVIGVGITLIMLPSVASEAPKELRDM